MKFALFLAAMAIAAPAVSQEASPRLDWSKPQVIDPPLPFQPPINEFVTSEALPIEVIPLLTGDRRHSACTFTHSLTVGTDADAQALYDQCVREAQNATVEPNAPAVEAEPDPRLRNFSPEMREKLRRFLPKPEQE